MESERDKQDIGRAKFERDQRVMERLVALSKRALAWARSALGVLWRALLAARRSVLFARTVAAIRTVSPRLLRSLSRWRQPVLRALVVVLFAEGIVWAITGPFVQRVQPGYVGVRHSQWGGGVETHDFAPGLHWNLPGLHEWHAIDAGTHEAEFGTFSPALEVRTPEGNVVGIAVSVPYRLIPGRAHRLVAESLRSGHREIVRATTQAVLLSELGRASSEDWLREDRRSEVLERASRAVAVALEPLHVQSERVLLQALRFPAPYETKLLEIQRGAQSKSLNEASAALKQVQVVVQRGIEENARTVQERRDERDMELTELRVVRKRDVRMFEMEAEALVHASRLSSEEEFERLVDEGRRVWLAAEVEGKSLSDRALAGKEGRLYLAVEAARALQLGEVVIDARDPRLPNLLDLEQAAGLFLPDDE